MSTHLSWALLAAVVACAPLVLAALSPLLATRDAVWIAGSLTGVAAMSLLFLQPLWLLASVRGSSASAAWPYLKARSWHRWGGAAIVVATLLHVGALYVTSPQDVVDALLFESPTPFSVYGVTGLGAVVLMAVLSLWRLARGARRTPGRAWRWLHGALAVAVVGLGGVHAWLIDGALSLAVKLALSVAALVAMALGIRRLVRLRWGPG